MANIKLTENTWDASGVYDDVQGKTQKQFNSDLKNATFSSIGNMYRGSFSVNANSTHSSSNDKIFVNIPSGQTFNIGFDANAYGPSNLVMLYATKSDSSTANIANYYLGTTQKRIFEITPAYDITALGMYYQNDSGQKVDVNIFVSWGNADMEVLKNASYDATNNKTNIGKLYRLDFEVNASSSHSSSSDQIAASIPANTKMIIGLDVSAADSTSLAQFYGIRADGQGSVNFLNIYPDATINKISEITASYDFSAIGLFYSNTTTEKVYVHTFVSIDQPDLETLYDLEGEQKFVNAAIGADVESFLSHYADTTESDTFALFSDPHYLMTDGNMTEHQISTITAEWLRQVKVRADAVNAKSIICCGDLLNSGDTDTQACYKLALHDAIAKKTFGDKYHLAFGNHDSKFDTIDQDIIDNMLYAEEDTQKAYFTVKTPKTIYYYLNTGTDQDGQMTSYRWEQIEWLADKLGSGTDENRIVVMHIVSTSSSAATFEDGIVPMAENVIDLVEAYNAKDSVTLNSQTYDFSTATGKVRCIFCGHTHYDTVYTTSNDLPVVCMKNTTQIGVKNQMTFDLGFLDYDNDTLYLHRIGDGSDRTVTLA